MLWSSFAVLARTAAGEIGEEKPCHVATEAFTIGYCNVGGRYVADGRV